MAAGRSKLKGGSTDTSYKGGGQSVRAQGLVESAVIGFEQIRGLPGLPGTIRV